MQKSGPWKRLQCGHHCLRGSGFHVAVQRPAGPTRRLPSQYDPGLLFPIPRATNRASLQLGAALPFTGVDLWNAYELSWLDARGKPRVAMATFSFPADSPNIVESKSFKLYLNSFNQTRLPNAQALRDRLGATWPPPPARPWGWSSSARSALAN